MNIDSNTRNMLIGLGIMAVVMALILNHRQSTNAPQPLPSPSKKADGPIIPQTLSGKPTDLTPQQMETIASRKEMRRMQSAGFTDLPVQSGKGRLKYKVNALERTCTTGDLDIIDLDLKFRKMSGEQLVFTVESISHDDKFAPLVQPVSLTGLRANVGGQFMIPLPARPKILGLFLCSFSMKAANLGKEKRVCADLKNRFTIPELAILQRANLGAHKNIYPKENKLFFFQLLVAGPKGLSIYRNKQTFNYNLKIMREAMELDGRNSYLDGDFKRGVEMMQSVTSVAPLVTSDQVILYLPHRGNCQQRYR